MLRERTVLSLNGTRLLHCTLVHKARDFLNQLANFPRKDFLFVFKRFVNCQTLLKEVIAFLTLLFVLFCYYLPWSSKLVVQTSKLTERKKF